MLGRPKRRERPLTAADLGSFLRSLAGLYKQPHTGNPQLSEALLKLSVVLTEGKSNSPEYVARHALEAQPSFLDGLDFSELPTSEVRKVIDNADTTKASLLILAHERLGMALSRLEKMPREELVDKIEAALAHEESLGIIADEASRHGQARTS